MTLSQVDSDLTHVRQPLTGIGIAHRMGIPHCTYALYIYLGRKSENKLSAAVAYQYVSTVMN